MANCPVCNTRKGKRQCLIFDKLICSQCCGEIRKEETCTGCIFYQAPKRDYRKTPAFSTKDMEFDVELIGISNSIEAALCAFDQHHNKAIRDEIAIGIFEKLLDKYYFKDKKSVSENQLLLEGLQYIDQVIINDLNDVDNDTLVKILGVLYYVSKRRTKYGREYLDFIHQYVGSRIGPGIRMMGGL